MNHESNSIFRGGSWYNQSSNVRVGLSGRDAFGDRSSYLGIRLVRFVNPLQQLGEVINGQ